MGKLEDILFATFLIIVVLFVGSAIYLGIQNMNNVSAQISLCQTNGYAGRIVLNDRNYCYSLQADKGQLILVDTLEGDGIVRE